MILKTFQDDLKTLIDLNTVPLRPTVYVHAYSSQNDRFDGISNDTRSSMLKYHHAITAPFKNAANCRQNLKRSAS